ncbi:MAG: hypothetical protein FWF59_02510 [Turicibacter sp.]|nr:hypothetical protein [Turicibacter sp.]
MAVIIEVAKTTIPVKFGELDFTYQADDASRWKLQEKFKALDAREKKLKEDQAEEQEWLAYLQESYDLLLGDGAFEQIYMQTPSWVILAGHLQVLVNNLLEEMVDRSLQGKKKKYLGG